MTDVEAAFAQAAAVATPDDLAQARDAAETIAARGFNRGRSLTHDLERLIRAQRTKRSQS